jgi:dTMP kinase
MLHARKIHHSRRNRRGGKSTHLEWLAGSSRPRNRGAGDARAGRDRLGERLRELLLDREQRLAPETETLLMFAARREHWKP